MHRVPQTIAGLGGVGYRYRLKASCPERIMGLPLSCAAGKALEKCLVIKYQRPPEGKRLELAWIRIMILPLSFYTSVLILLLRFEVAVAILVSLLYPGRN